LLNLGLKPTNLEAMLYFFLGDSLVFDNKQAVLGEILGQIAKK
jgi:hypothetical protein